MEPGTPLREGRYRILRKIGEGAQAETFAAADVREGREVAIKRFSVKGAASWKEVELAEREAAVLASLDHPLLPRFLEHFEEGGALYLVTELVSGQSLLELQKRGHRMSDEEVVGLLSDLSETLRYLHHRSPPVIHRDIKPGNVMKRTDGRYVLVDFGAVRAKLEPRGGSTVVGTFGYMAPEQFQGRAMPQSDVYSAGATVLALLTGTEPEALPHKGLAIDVRAALPGHGDRLIRGLTGMLDPDPDRRDKELGPFVEALKRKGLGGARGPERRRDRRHEERARREAERAARQAAKRAEREARRRVGGHSGREEAELYPPPPLVRFFIALARVVVLLTVVVAVPTVLSLLSLLFGRHLRVAAARVRDAGLRASERMAQVPVDLEAQESARVRVASPGTAPPPPKEARPHAEAYAEPAPDDAHRAEQEAEAEAEAEADAREEARRRS